MLSEYFHIQLQPNIELLIPLEHTGSAISLPVEQICPIPGIPPAVLGVVNQRGKLLWVIQLSNLLGLRQSETSLRAQYNLTLLVLSATSRTTGEQESRMVGCVVSTLKEIIFLDSKQFKPVPAKSPILCSFLSGMAQIERSLVSVLNVNAVFTALSNLDTSLVSS
jgi:twitching motility protein PilI